MIYRTYEVIRCVEIVLSPQKKKSQKRKTHRLKDNIQTKTLSAVFLWGEWKTFFSCESLKTNEIKKWGVLFPPFHLFAAVYIWRGVRTSPGNFKTKVLSGLSAAFFEGKRLSGLSDQNSPSMFSTALMSRRNSEHSRRS